MRKVGEVHVANLLETGTWCEAALTGPLIGNLDAAAKGLIAAIRNSRYVATGSRSGPFPGLPGACSEARAKSPEMQDRQDQRREGGLLDASEFHRGISRGEEM
jgi:hypothetical protein